MLDIYDIFLCCNDVNHTKQNNNKTNMFFLRKLNPLNIGCITVAKVYPTSLQKTHALL